MRTHTDPGTGIRYHEITNAELKAGDEILPWLVGQVETTGTFRMLLDAQPAPEGMVTLVTDRAGTDQRPGEKPVRIRERAGVVRRTVEPPPGSPTRD